MFHRIVMPTDFSDCAREAWELAKRVSRASGGELFVSHVLPEPLRLGQAVVGEQSSHVQESARAWVEAALDDLVKEARAHGLEARAALRTGVAAEEIVALAQDERADLIVIGTHGRSGMSRLLLGSVADRVVRLAPCPVLTIRQLDKAAAA